MPFTRHTELHTVRSQARYSPQPCRRHTFSSGKQPRQLEITGLLFGSDLISYCAHELIACKTLTTLNKHQKDAQSSMECLSMEVRWWDPICASSVEYSLLEGFLTTWPASHVIWLNSKSIFELIICYLGWQNVLAGAGAGLLFGSDLISYCARELIAWERQTTLNKHEKAAQSSVEYSIKEKNDVSGPLSLRLINKYYWTLIGGAQT